MRRAYILVYSESTGGHETIRAWANKESKVLHWRYDMPNSLYLISETGANELARSLRAFTGDRGRFLIMEASDNRQGWLPSETWHLLRHKEHKPKRA